MNVGPAWGGDHSAGWVRCVVTNVGPTPVRIVPVVVGGEVGQGAVTGGAVRADQENGTALRLGPRDCRRVFATEHLNSNTPVHVIAALLGHASLDTVMIYAKLYPDTLVEGYRNAMRGLYDTVYDDDTTRTPTPQEWAAFAAR
jgi:Phage integrase family